MDLKLFFVVLFSSFVMLKGLWLDARLYVLWFLSFFTVSCTCKVYRLTLELRGPGLDLYKSCRV